jgi:YVTN family beta-propeller protein
MNMKTQFIKKFLVPVCCMLLVVFVLAGGAPARAAKDAAKTGPTDAAGEKQTPADPNVLKREGLVIEFLTEPTPGRSMDGKELHEGDFLDLAFKISDAASGEPIQAQFPGVWLDLSKSWEGEEKDNRSCNDRVGLYLQGLVGIRPMIDLNTYFILSMNRDASISVIDPVIGISGITKLYALVNLKRPGADWTKTGDQNRLFVSMPEADMVAVVNTGTFKVKQNLDAGKNPVRIALQPDEKYLWVGNDGKDESQSGVTVIDVDKLQTVESIPTGSGHHEIAFSDDSRYAFVSNRDAGTISVIDVQRLKKVKDVKTGVTPLSLAYSILSKSVYVTDGVKGEITVIDGRTHQITSRIETKPGMGPMGFSQDGRWGVAINSIENAVYAIDPATNRIAHTIPVGKKPYQVAFSRSFAYVRSLGTERVSLIELAKLGAMEKPPVVTFGAGEKAPEIAKDISIASAIVEAPGEAAVMVVSPGDETIYYYMEGMNAPMGNFRNYGHRPRAVQVVDRSMQEKEPGVYSSTVRIPEPGTYDVAFLLDSPSILHCFEVTARPNPLLGPKGPALAIEYLMQNRLVPANEKVKFRFKLTDPHSGIAAADLKGVRIRYFLAPGQYRTEVPARHIADGIYEAELRMRRAGAYYVYVAYPPKKVLFNDLPYMTLMASSGKRKK